VPHTFHIVDVFAERPYAGNPLAVVLEADDLDDEAMLRIAAEMNYSETTFVGSTPEPGGSHRVRIFTPAHEIAFAGHPILGTAWLLRGEPAGTVRLALSVGEVPVRFEPLAGGGEVAWFAAPPTGGGRVAPRERIARALQLSPLDVDGRFPAQTFSAGTSALLVPLRSRQALRRCRLDLEAFAPLAADGFPSLVYVFCAEPEDSRNDFCARFFFVAHGVREDPASGNAAAFFGAYLLEHGYFARHELDLRIEQGGEVGRPSLVRLRARGRGPGVEVEVGGRVLATARGELIGTT